MRRPKTCTCIEGATPRAPTPVIATGPTSVPPASAHAPDGSPRPDTLRWTRSGQSSTTSARSPNAPSAMSAHGTISVLVLAVGQDFRCQLQPAAHHRLLAALQGEHVRNAIGTDDHECFRLYGHHSTDRTAFEAGV